jgi:hypothetical protein
MMVAVGDLIKQILNGMTFNKLTIDVLCWSIVIQLQTVAVQNEVCL